MAIYHKPIMKFQLERLMSLIQCIQIDQILQIDYFTRTKMHGPKKTEDELRGLFTELKSITYEVIQLVEI